MEPFNDEQRAHVLNEATKLIERAIDMLSRIDPDSTLHDAKSLEANVELIRAEANVLQYDADHAITT